MQARFGSGLNQNPTWLGAITFVAVLVLTAAAWSQSSLDPGKTKTSPTIASTGPLDGRQFNARIVRADANVEERGQPLGDQLTFRDGRFSSAICKKFNFVEAPYWVRVEGDKIYFLAELASPTDGAMRWKGVIRGNTLEGTMRWEKKRWYWTINVEHKIHGELTGGDAASPPSH